MTIIVDAAFKVSVRSIVPAKMENMVEAWCRQLYGIIPLDQLHNAFHLAFDRHTTQNPISAHELKIAWDEIRKNLMDNPTNREEEIANCRESYLHIDVEGFVAYADPFHLERDIVLPCATCRPDHFAREKIAHARREAPNHPVVAFKIEADTITEWAEKNNIRIRRILPSGHPRTWNK